MNLITWVIKQRNLTLLERERKDREDYVFKHNTMYRKTCHCANCDKYRDEISQITARIREVHATKGSNGGDKQD